jgi:hypothetical protein
MHYHCCHTAVTIARKVKIREVDPDPDIWPPFAVAFVCQGCYSAMNTTDGVGAVGQTMYQIDGPSRFGRAPLFTSEMADEYRRAEAVKLGANAS